MRGLWRTRWAAIGAAVAVSLGAGGIIGAGALVSTGDKLVFVAVTPCRLVDTRPASSVGPRTAALGPGERYTVAAKGNAGNCKLPSDPKAIVANVTIVSPTAASYLTVFPADKALPKASNLNWVAGQAPTPNQVTSDLSADGKITIFNRDGQVHVIIDVVGYYTNHRHDDRYYTEAEVDAAFADAEVSIDVTDGIYFDSFTFVPEATFDTQETVTTDRAGLLMVSKFHMGSTTCSAGGARLYFLVVDGTPIRSSGWYEATNDVVKARFSGVTEESMPAGDHVVAVGVECVGNSFASIALTHLVASASAVVLPTG